MKLSKEVLFQLEDDEDLQAAIKRIQDEFLDLYSLYQKMGSTWIKEELLHKAYELHVLDSSFTFHI
ncbi:MAG: hypothetical protein A3G87_06450 [Omnitrophica bacterium RIFCSPLOWO2_12_FULL_50_11]|nr:MAG: hypothetical protein A3G87_06450 [Omnitrophica bacterium RIFCSPLOWO2_12_FULL_50_11]